MPVPKPSGTFDSYMETCMSWAADEHPEMDQQQRVAMCMSTAREAGLPGTPSKAKSKAVAAAWLEVTPERIKAAGLVKALIGEVHKLRKALSGTES